MKNYVTSATKKDRDVETIIGTLNKTVFESNNSLHALLKYDSASYMPIFFSFTLIPNLIINLQLNLKSYLTC